MKLYLKKKFQHLVLSRIIPKMFEVPTNTINTETAKMTTKINNIKLILRMKTKEPYSKRFIFKIEIYHPIITCKFLRQYETQCHSQVDFRQKTALLK